MFHDYSVGCVRVEEMTRSMPQRIKTNVLNETYFFYGCVPEGVRREGRTRDRPGCQRAASYAIT